MKKYDCIILTDSRYIEDSSDSYNHNIYKEDDYVVQALKNIDLQVERLAWDDPNFDWSTTKSIVFRTTWDYFDRFEVFSKWLETVSKQTQLINSEAIIYWNIDKHYLLDLQKQNIAIAETYFIEKGTTTTLKQLHIDLNLQDSVLKPCISGAARHTYKLNKNNLNEYEAVFETLIAKEAMMLQPFQYNIVSKGEISMVVINGNYTHAVLKTAKKGDFRVQDDFGGSVFEYTPTTEEITFAETTVKACTEFPLYARIDIFEDNNGNIALSELELIEPELWFRNNPDAAKKLADAIKERIA